MPLMFADSAFNQTIAAWNVSKVTDFYGTFRCSAFDGGISKWDTSRVQIMRNMFMNSPFSGVASVDLLAMQHAWSYERNDAVVDAFTLPQLE